MDANRPAPVEQLQAEAENRRWDGTPSDDVLEAGVPYRNECRCPPGRCACLEIPGQVERVTTANSHNRNGEAKG